MSRLPVPAAEFDNPTRTFSYASGVNYPEFAPEFTTETFLWGTRGAFTGIFRKSNRIYLQAGIVSAGSTCVNVPDIEIARVQSVKLEASVVEYVNYLGRPGDVLCMDITGQYVYANGIFTRMVTVSKVNTYIRNMTVDDLPGSNEGESYTTDELLALFREQTPEEPVLEFNALVSKDWTFKMILGHFDYLNPSNKNDGAYFTIAKQTRDDLVIAPPGFKGGSFFETPTDVTGNIMLRPNAIGTVFEIIRY